MADRIKTQFPDLNVQIGGQTGLDISDSDKSQIIKYFNIFRLIKKIIVLNYLNTM